MSEQSPKFLIGPLETLKGTPHFEQWRVILDQVKRLLAKRVSPRDLQPISRAGAKEDAILERLAFIVCNFRYSSSTPAQARAALRDLAAQLKNTAEHADRVISRLLISQQMREAIEAQVVEMRTLSAELEKEAGSLGLMCRGINKVNRNMAIAELLSYVHLSTAPSRKNFDSEIAALLTSTFRAAGKPDRQFTAAGIKKFRQRHLPGLRTLALTNMQVSED
jgi:hypothetical protein